MTTIEKTTSLAAFGLAAALSVLCLSIGAKLIGDAISGLTG
jgi:hypothetical protein